MKWLVLIDGCVEVGEREGGFWGGALVAASAVAGREGRAGGRGHAGVDGPEGGGGDV